MFISLTFTLRKWPNKSQKGDTDVTYVISKFNSQSHCPSVSERD